MEHGEQNSREEELEVNESRLSRMVESARLGTWEWNIESGDLAWSRECLEMFGLPVDAKMSYEHFLEAIYPEDRERVDRAVQVAIQTGDEYSTEMRAVWPDGTIHWVASRGRVHFNKAGRPERMSGAAMDITRLKQTEEELKSARAEAKAQVDNLAAVFDAMPAAAFFSQDRKCERMTSNRAAYELLRMPYGSNTSKSAPPAEQPAFIVLENGHEVPAEELPLQQAAATGQAVRGKEYEIRFEDGSSIYEFGHAVPLFDDTGSVRGAIGAFMDITDRKVMEERLRAATERFQVTLRNTPITVSNQGLDLRYNWIYNPVGSHHAAEIIGKRDTELLERPEDAAMSEAIKTEVLRTGVRYHGDMTVMMNGVPRHYHVNIDPQRDGQGRICGLTCASFDFTEHKRAQEEREQLWQQRQLALDAAKMGWWHYDALTSLGNWDRMFQEIFGLSTLTGPSEDVIRLFHPDDQEKVRVSLREAMDPVDPKAYVTEYRIIRPDGSERWVEVYGGAEFVGEGEARKALSCSGTARDVTERKVAEEELRASEARYRDLVANLDHEVQARTQELQERNEEVLRTSEELRALSSRLLQVQDEERRRIARDLHDSSGQILTAIGLDLANIAEQANAEKVQEAAPQLTKQVAESQKLVDLLHRELRTTTYLLHPPLLDETGLFSAISWYVQGMSQRSGMRIDFEMAEDFGRLSREMELLVFRLVQESLTNIHRHSGSKTSAIRISRGAEAVTVDVEDHGKGISREKLATIQAGSSGLGIRAMRERLRQFGGELRIDSKGAGTRVLVTIPISPASGSPEDSGIESLPTAI